jgi:hypothetical protein
MELEDGHGDGGDQKMIVCASTWKVYLKVSFCFATQDTIEDVSDFRIDNRTIKRKNL